MAKTPPGGPANINGVSYQMLWSLLRATKLHVSRFVADDRTGAPQSISLILEPAGGGGDLQECTPTGRIIQQLKARSDNGTWSLRQVVEGVLPDLYKAVDLASPETEYRFITEGRMGLWRDAYAFFVSLKERPCGGNDILAALDDKKGVPFRHKLLKEADVDKDGTPSQEKNWTADKYTERSLFEQIVTILQDAVAKTESIDTIRLKTWHLLARFVFVPDMSQERLDKEISSILLAFIDSDAELKDKRDALLTGLQKRAAAGNAEIDASELLTEYGLTAAPLTAWACLRERSQAHLRGQLQRLGYAPEQDVRRSLADSTLDDWSNAHPLLVLSGESGQGKSWAACAAALTASEEETLVLLIAATGDAERDLNRAACDFSHAIRDSDAILPIDRVSERLRRLVYPRPTSWLTLIIDGLQDTEEAIQLAQEPWEEWGIRCIFTCSPGIAQTVAVRAGARSQQIPVKDFSTHELQMYLTARLGEHWTTIPSDVRGTLRRPLLASIYCDLADGAWQPENEYGLYKEFWNKLFAGDHPLDAAGLKQLARSLVQGQRYPWTGEHLASAKLDNAAVGRLCRAGWLKSSGPDRFEIGHDRLLNWAVAEALVSATLGGTLPRNELIDIIIKCFSPNAVFSGRYLGYVPMDTVYLLSIEAAAELLHALLDAFEARNWPSAENLYKLLPSVGDSILPVLLDRLERIATKDDSPLLNRIVEAIATFDGHLVHASALKLLENASGLVQRTGMRVLAKRPCKEALTKLWQLHCESQRDPSRFLGPHDSHHYVYEDSFGALRACVRIAPEWLEATIASADAEADPMETLAYLLANVPDSMDLWRRCKPTLFRKIKPQKERCLAANISVHRDSQEVEWLRQRIIREDELMGSSALRALARIDPDLAVREMSHLSERELYLSRHWCLAELMSRRSEGARAVLLQRMRGAKTPWHVALVYQDDENSMDSDTLRFLLDALEGLLDSALAQPSHSTEGGLCLSLRMLASVARLDLLRVCEQYRGTALEHKLTTWLLSIKPRSGLNAGRLDREPGMNVLYKIGGEGFTSVVNSWLSADNRYGRLDGLQFAAKRPNSETIDILQKITVQDELWNGHPLEQGKAATALASIGRRDRIVKYAHKWGSVSREVWQQCWKADPLDDSLLADVLAAVNECSTPTPGVIVALGIGNRHDKTDWIRSVLSRVTPDSETALACVITLSHLEDHSPTTESLFIKQLSVLNHQYAAACGLYDMGTESALDALLHAQEAKYSDGLAVLLWRHPRTRMRAAELLWQEFHKSPRSVMVDSMSDLFGYVNTQEARDYLREAVFSQEGSCWHVGEKERAIKGLAQADPETAFLAARTALAVSSNHDRERYPDLLIQLNRTKATQVLLFQVAEERSTRVVWAIGRALAGEDIVGSLKSQFVSPDPKVRLGACRIAAWNEKVDEMIGDLQLLLDDPDQRVSDAARESLGRIEQRRETNLLAEAVLAEHNDARRWVLLDCLLDLADPGDEHQPLPNWAETIWSSLSVGMRQHANERLKSRRKKLAEKAAKIDKD